MDIIVVNGEEIDVIGQKLDLLAACTKINYKDIDTIATLLKYRESITELDLSQNHFGKLRSNAVEKIISAGSRLTSLRLCQNSFELPEHWNIISNALINLRCLTELDISNNSLTDAGMRNLTAALQDNFSLKKLSMRYIFMKEDALDGLVQLVLHNVNLTHLDLFGLSLNGTVSSVPLAQALAKNRTITYLDMGSQNLINTNKNRTELYELIGSISSLKTLKLESHSMNDYEAEVLIHALLQSRASITSLDLTQNIIEMKKSVALATLIDTCHSLTELQIGKNTFTPRGLEILEAAIAKSGAITCLGLPDMRSAIKNSDSAFTLFKDNRSLTELDLTGFTFMDMPKIARISFIGLKNIKKLNLGMCHLNTDVELVVGALIDSPIEDLNLEHNYLNYKGGEAIPNLIRRTKTLKKLNLARNLLDEEFRPIIAALSVNNTITDLNISGNELGKSGSKMLQQSLANNTTMKILVAASVGFDIHSVKDLIATNRSLTMLDARYNGHNSSDYNVILPAIQTNMFLTEIYWMYRYLDIDRGATTVRLFPSMLNEGEKILFQNKRRKIFASSIYMTAQTILLSCDQGLFAAIPLEVLHRILFFYACRYFSKKQVGIICALVDRSSLNIDVATLFRAIH